MPICRAALKHARHYQWPVQPHRSHRVIQHAFMRPLRKRLFLRLRKPEVHLRPKHLVHPQIPVRRQQFLSPHQPQRVVKVSRHQILPTLTSGQSERSRAHSMPTRLVRQHPSILVIRMRDDHQQARPRSQLDQALFQRQSAFIRGIGSSVTEARTRSPARFAGSCSSCPHSAAAATIDTTPRPASFRKGVINF